MNRKKKGKTIWISGVCIICLIVFLYMVILPRYAIYQIKNANCVDIWCGEVIITINDKDIINEVLDCMDITRWERKPRKNVQIGLPNMYVMANNKYNLDFFEAGTECYIKVYFHSSKIEIATYLISAAQYQNIVKYLYSIS